MFLSIRWVSNNLEDTTTYEIVDRDFYIRFSCDGYLYNVINGIINCYEERGLNVAANLVIAMTYMRDHWYTHNIMPIQKIIEMNKQSGGKIKKYEKDIEKYLCLL
jgi:hypothetical protein